MMWRRVYRIGALTTALCAVAASAACGQQAGDAALLTLVRDLTLSGTAQGLTPISWLAVGADGMIAAAQPQDNTVRLFSATGAPLGSVGRRGTAPSEFRNLATSGWTGDTLWVYDGLEGQVSLILPRRGVVRRFLRPVAKIAGPDARSVPAVNPRSIAAVFPGGSVLQFAQVASPALPPSYLVLRLSQDTVLDGVAARVAPNDAGFISVAAPGVAVPFAEQPQTLINIAPNGSRIATAASSIDGLDAGTFRVVSLGSAGDTLFARRYPFVGVPIPKGVADSAFGATLRDIRIERLADAFGATAKIPAVYPPVERVLAGADGTTWVQLRAVPGGTPWLVLDPTGNVIGRTTVPLNVRIMVADRTEVWAVEMGANEVDNIVRYHFAP